MWNISWSVQSGVAVCVAFSFGLDNGSIFGEACKLPGETESFPDYPRTAALVA